MRGPYEVQHASARVYHGDRGLSDGLAAYCACAAANSGLGGSNAGLRRGRDS
jgi:hypothetical protein